MHKSSDAVRQSRTSVFTKNTRQLSPKFGFLSIDFPDFLEYN